MVETLAIPASSRTRAGSDEKADQLPGRSVSLPAGRRLLAALMLVLPLALGSATAVAQSQTYNYTKQGGISVEQAAAMVRRETGGRVLSANPVKSNGQRGYNIRVLIDGKRVKKYYVDAEGRISPK